MHRPKNIATRLKKWAARSLLRNVATQSERRSVISSEHASSFDASGMSSVCNEDTETVLETAAQVECPDECPFRSDLVDEAQMEPHFPEPQSDDGSLSAVAQRLYTKINSLWQTRILRLLPGPIGSALAGELLVADLVMLPGLVLHDEGRLISFQALSYCCGESILTRRIQLNGQQLPITENLYYALQVLRQEHEPIFLWVDAICIHQHLPEEKSQQVINMFSIYRKASHVDVWLGTNGMATGLAMAFLSSATKKLISHIHAHHKDFDFLLGGIRELLSRPWFQRIWVKQELFAASRVVVHCGTDVAYGDFITDWTSAVEIMLEVQEELHMDPTYPFKRHCEILRTFRRAKPKELTERDGPELENPLRHSAYHMDVINVLERCAGSQCSQPQDHVYALLGMTDVKTSAESTAHLDGKTLIIDYTKSATDVLTDICRHVIRRDESLAILHLDSSYGPTSTMIDLPSWVPDFRFERRPLLRYFDARWNGGWNSGEPSERHYLKILLQRRLKSSTRAHLEVDSRGLPSSKLAVTGRRIGSIVPDNTLWKFRSFHIETTKEGWNIFHERHLYRHGVPKELLKTVKTTLEAEVSAPDLVTISTAVHKSAFEYWLLPDRSKRSFYVRKDYSKTDMQTAEYFLVNINWKRELLCSVVVSWSRRGWSTSGPSWAVVSPDQSGFVQCSYTVESYQRSESVRELPSSWIVPREAKEDDVLIAAEGSPLPMLVRLRPSTATWEYVGPAMPCQMKVSEALPSEMIEASEATARDWDQDLMERFVLE